jgi:S1-C subfamily serine protease
LVSLVMRRSENVSPRSGALVRAAAAVVAAVLSGCAGAHTTADSPRVLGVRVPATAERPDEVATAFAVRDGRAVTVAHVLRAHRPVFVGGRRARVLRVDRRLDVALLAVRGLRAASPGVGAAHAGEVATVLRAGAAQSVHATVRRRITARLHRAGGPVAVRPALEVAAAVMPGDSGAPLVDGRGRVLGMVFAQASDREGVAYAVDAGALRAVLGR